MGEILAEWGPDIWEATLRTLQMALGSFAIALIVGVIVVSMRVSPIPPLVRAAEFFVSFFRNTPLLVLFFLAYFGLGDLDLIFSGYATVTVALGLYTGAYMAEVLRSGINSVDQGQAEAGRSIGLGFVQLLRLVVIPQAVRTVIAPIGNLFVANFKNTAVGLTISAPELTALSRRMIDRSVNTWSALIMVAVIYLFFLLLAGWGFRGLEAKYAIKR